MEVMRTGMFLFLTVFFLVFVALKTKQNEVMSECDEFWKVRGRVNARAVDCWAMFRVRVVATAPGNCSSGRVTPGDP